MMQQKMRFSPTFLTTPGKSHNQVLLIDFTLYVQITQSSDTYHITLLRGEYIRLVCDGHSWKYLVGFFNRVLEIGLWPHPLDEQCESC